MGHRLVERSPEFGAGPVGRRWAETVGDHDPFDHVGDDCAPGASVEPDRDDGTVGATADRPIDSDESGRTPKARPDQPPPARFAVERSGGSGELDGGGGLHTPSIMTTGYLRVQPPGAISAPGIARIQEPPR